MPLFIATVQQAAAAAAAELSGLFFFPTAVRERGYVLSVDRFGGFSGGLVFDLYIFIERLSRLSSVVFAGGLFFLPAQWIILMQFLFSAFLGDPQL